MLLLFIACSSGNSAQPLGEDATTPGCEAPTDGLLAAGVWGSAEEEADYRLAVEVDGSANLRGLCVFADIARADVSGGQVDWAFEMMSDDSAGSSVYGPGRLAGAVCSGVLTGTVETPSGSTSVRLTYGESAGGVGCD